MERPPGWGWDRECAVDSGHCYQKTRPRLGDRGQGQQGGQRQLCGTLVDVSGGREGGRDQHHGLGEVVSDMRPASEQGRNRMESDGVWAKWPVSRLGVGEQGGERLQTARFWVQSRCLGRGVGMPLGGVSS